MWKRSARELETNQVTMRREQKKIKAVTKTGYGKGFECMYAKMCQLFLFRARAGANIHLRFLASVCVLYAGNVWSFVACINHLYNHKSHAVWMHKKGNGIEVKFPVHTRDHHTSNEMVLLPHIFNFDLCSFYSFFYSFCISEWKVYDVSSCSLLSQDFALTLRPNVCLLEMINWIRIHTCNLQCSIATPYWT